MGRSDLRRGETIPFRIEPEPGKVLENEVQPAANDRCDILSEDSDGAGLFDDPGVLEPQAASVAFDDACAFSGEADVLAGETADDPEVFDAAELAPANVSNVAAENRRSLQRRFFHPAQEAGRRVGFPLDVTHAPGNDAEGFAAKAESNVEPAVAGEEGQIVDGNSHTLVLLEFLEVAETGDFAGYLFGDAGLAIGVEHAAAYAARRPRRWHARHVSSAWFCARSA